MRTSYNWENENGGKYHKMGRIFRNVEGLRMFGLRVPESSRKSSEHALRSDNGKGDVLNKVLIYEREKIMNRIMWTSIHKCSYVIVWWIFVLLNTVSWVIQYFIPAYDVFLRLTFVMLIQWRKFNNNSEIFSRQKSHRTLKTT